MGQKTIVSGKVYDADTQEPLPFVNLIFKGTKIGTSSDINGNYYIETYYASDSLVCSFVGYARMAFKIKKDRSQRIDFPLHQSSVELQMVEVRPDKKYKDPAIAIMKNVMNYKKINDREKLDSYEYEVYNKIEFDLNNIDEKFMNRKVFKPFKFVFENIDSSEAKPFLPLFMSETLSRFHYRKNPKAQREHIIANMVSGIENESVSQFLGDMHQNVNVYKNYVEAFGKSFMSPVSNLGLLSYNYYLTDSAFINKYWCYKIRFKPKRKHELTFDGEMWIHDTTYAIKEIECTISGDANINWIHEFSVRQEFEQVEPEVWLMVKDELVVDFALTEKTIGFYGRKISTYKDFVINKPKNDDFFSGAENVIVADSAQQRSDNYWDSARHEKLTDNQKQIYAMVDTIRDLPAFRTYVDIITLFVTGYKVWKKIEIGPYFTMYSWNRIEGHRFRLGGRTSNDFSKRLMIEAYVAYGTDDQQFKYSGGFNYFLSKKPRQRIGMYYKHDVEQLGLSADAWRQDNILSSVFRRNPVTLLNGFDEYYAWYERDWFQGFSNKLNLTYREIRPLGNLMFLQSPSRGEVVAKSSLTTAEVSLYTRFAYKEKYVAGEFERKSLGTKWPILQLQYAVGIPNVIQSEYEYHKVVFNIQDKVRINPLGYSEVILEGGKIFGSLPYPLLELHNGNETYFYDMTAFNLMNYYEFASDQYASAAITHHFNGLLLNHIPFMRKLKWREIATGQIVYGTLEDKHRQELIFPATLSTLGNKPYYEAGIGIENIAKLFRVDAIWRLAYINKSYVDRYESLGNSKIAKFGIRAAMQFKF